MIHLRLVLLVVGRRERAISTLSPPRPRPRLPRTLRVLGTPGVRGAARHRPCGYSTEPQWGHIPEESSKFLASGWRHAAPGWRHTVAGLLRGLRTDRVSGRRCSQERKEVSTGDVPKAGAFRRHRRARHKNAGATPVATQVISRTQRTRHVCVCKYTFPSQGSIACSRPALLQGHARYRQPSTVDWDVISTTLIQDQRSDRPFSRSLLPFYPLVRSYAPSSSHHARIFINDLFGKSMYLRPRVANTLPE